MKKILGLTVAALLVIGLVGGGTWAYFSDTEESTGNLFSAGTLDLGLSNSTGDDPIPTGSITATFTESEMAPGDNLGSERLYVYNSDTGIDMADVFVSFAVGGYTENTPNSVDDYNLTTGTDNLTNMIKTGEVRWGSTRIGALEDISIQALIDGGTVRLGDLDAGDEEYLEIEWIFNSAATNGCQGDSVDLTIIIQGNQG